MSPFRRLMSICAIDLLREPLVVYTRLSCSATCKHTFCSIQYSVGQSHRFSDAQMQFLKKISAARVMAGKTKQIHFLWNSKISFCRSKKTSKIYIEHFAKKNNTMHCNKSMLLSLQEYITYDANAYLCNYHTVWIYFDDTSRVLYVNNYINNCIIGLHCQGNYSLMFWKACV